MPDATRNHLYLPGTLPRGKANAFLALDVIRGERIYCTDSTRCDELDLYVMRRAGDLEPFERERRRMELGFDPIRPTGEERR